MSEGNPDFVEEKYRAMLNSIAQVLDETFNPDMPFRKVGFALLLFDFETSGTEQGRLNYVSNAQRKDMIKALEEFIGYAKADTGPEIRHPKMN